MFYSPYIVDFAQNECISLPNGLLWPQARSFHRGVARQRPWAPPTVGATPDWELQTSHRPTAGNWGPLDSNSQINVDFFLNR